MDAKECIKTRMSIRKFKPDSVPVDVLLNAPEIQGLLQHFAYRRVVEQRRRAVALDPQHRGEPAGAGLEHRPGIGFVDALHVEVFPHLQQVTYAAAEIVCVDGEYRSVDGAGRSPAQYGKRILCLVGQQIADRLEHAHLIGGARAAAGEYQARSRLAPFHPMATAKAAPRCAPHLRPPPNSR